MKKAFKHYSKKKSAHWPDTHRLTLHEREREREREREIEIER